MHNSAANLDSRERLGENLAENGEQQSELRTIDDHDVITMT